MRIERHIFGSFSGYATLAKSAGISIEDARRLEGMAYNYGQNSDKRFLRGLTRNPSYYTHALRASRRGLTRAMEGRPDDNGRPTILLMSVIVSQRDWDTQMCGDVNLLLDDRSLWEWDGQNQVVAMDWTADLPDTAIQGRSTTKLLGLISQIERSVALRQRITIAEDDFSLAELRAIEMLIPPAFRSQFTSGFRTLSHQLPVSVNCLATEAIPQAISYRPQNDAPMSEYAEWLSNTELMNGQLPLVQVMEYRSFGMTKRRSAGSLATVPAAITMAPPMVQVINNAPRWPWAVVLILILAAGTGGYLAGSHWSARTAAEQPVAQTTVAHPAGDPPSTNPVFLSPQIDNEQRRSDELKNRSELRENLIIEIIRPEVEILLNSIDSVPKLIESKSSLIFIKSLLDRVADNASKGPTTQDMWVNRMRDDLLTASNVINTISDLNQSIEGWEASEDGKTILGEQKLSEKILATTYLKADNISREWKKRIQTIPGELITPKVHLGDWKSDFEKRVAKVSQWVSNHKDEFEALENQNPTSAPNDPTTAPGDPHSTQKEQGLGL